MKTLNNYINEALIKKDTKIKKEDELIYNFEEFIKQINGQSKFGTFESLPYNVFSFKHFKVKKCYSMNHGKLGVFYYFILSNMKNDSFKVLQIVSPKSQDPGKIKIMYRKLNKVGISMRDYLYFNTKGNQVNSFYINDIFIKKFIELLNQLYDENDKKITSLLNNFEKYCHENELYIKDK